MNSIRTLLSELIDYAGLFPPAGLGMDEAVRGYAAYRGSEHSWALGRFIAPAARLDEFDEAAKAHLSYDSDATPWKVSVLGGSDPTSDLSAINEFNRRHLDADEGRVFVDTIEVRATNVEEIRNAMDRAHRTLAVYIEIPISKDPQPLIDTIAKEGARAKMRAGGISPDAFPTSAELIRFLSACIRSDVSFKATAGLHHPIRSVQRLTYEPDSPWGLMHGFLNLFLAAAWMRAGLAEGQALKLLEETASEAFTFEEDGVMWRKQRLSAEQLTRSRSGFAIAFGSCSFEEPLEDLRSLGLL